MTESVPPAFAPEWLVIIPTYNERENLPVVVEQVLALDPRFGILVVDDNSPDGTGSVADDLADQHPGRVRVLHRPGKAGIGRAYVAGFSAALDSNASLIATMDADLSHAPSDLPRLVAATEAADLVLGSRYVPGGRTEGWPLHRRIMSRGGGRYARFALGAPIADLTGGFKVYRRSALLMLDLDRNKSDGYVFQIETTYHLLKQGLRVVEVPITFADRRAGRSKLSRRIVLEAMITVWRLRFERM